MTGKPPQELEFTGERFTPECVREIWYEHVHRYVLAAETVENKSVLDAACGEGYGSNLLAVRAGSVVGVDISQESISHASSRYSASNLSFQLADCRDLPFADGQFDCIVSFETLEHMADHERLIREFRRVLAPGGFLLISSPDKSIYTDQLKNENPFHVRELYRQELESLLGREFSAVRLMGQKLAFHSTIWPLESGSEYDAGESGAALPVVHHLEKEGLMTRLSGPSGQAVYLIALCAAKPDYLPQLDAGLWLFDDAEESVYKHYHHEIQKNMQAGVILQSRDAEIDQLKTVLEARGNELETARQVPWWHRLLGKS